MMGGVSNQEPCMRRRRRKGVQREGGVGGNGGVHTCDKVKLHLQCMLIASFLPFLGEGLWRGQLQRQISSLQHTNEGGHMHRNV